MRVLAMIKLITTSQERAGEDGVWAKITPSPKLTHCDQSCLASELGPRTRAEERMCKRGGKG